MRPLGLLHIPALFLLGVALSSGAGACNGTDAEVECSHGRAVALHEASGERACRRVAEDCSDQTERRVSCGTDDERGWGCQCEVRALDSPGGSVGETLSEGWFAADRDGFCGATGDEQERAIDEGCGWAIRYRTELCRCRDPHEGCLPCTAADERCTTASDYIACDASRRCLSERSCGSSEYYCAYEDDQPACHHCDVFSQCQTDADCAEAGCPGGAVCRQQEERTCGYCPAVWDHCEYAIVGSCECL